MNCPSCGAPMRLDPGADSLTCEYCHSIYFPEKNDDGVRVLEPAADGETCPVCAVPLMEASLQGARLRTCTRCRGLLIPMDAFASLVDALRTEGDGTVRVQPPDRSELERHLHCPHCHGDMDTHFYAGPGNVIVSDCERCLLVWLDHGKLERIAHAPDALRAGAEEAWA